MNGQKDVVSAYVADKEYLEAMRKYSKTTVTNEFDHYINSPPDPDITSPLQWWKAHKEQYPNLSKMARDILSVPASRSGVERQFSVTGRIATWQRNRLSAQTISNSMIFKAYLRSSKARIIADDDIIYDGDDDILASSVRDEGVPPEWIDEWYYKTSDESISAKSFKSVVENILERRREVI